MANSLRLVKLVDLRDGEALGLGDEEEGEDEGSGDESGPDEADCRRAKRTGSAMAAIDWSQREERTLGTEVGTSGLDDDGDDKGDDGVHSPVGGGGDGDALGGKSSREGLSADDPDDGTPSHGETGDEDAGEGDEDLARGVLSRKGGSDGSDDDLTGEHHEGSPEEDVSSGELVDNILRKVDKREGSIDEARKGNG
jgi:hypothetical protein